MKRAALLAALAAAAPSSAAAAPRDTPAQIRTSTIARCQQGGHRYIDGSYRTYGTSTPSGGLRTIKVSCDRVGRREPVVRCYRTGIFQDRHPIAWQTFECTAHITRRLAGATPPNPDPHGPYWRPCARPGVTACLGPACTGSADGSHTVCTPPPGSAGPHAHRHRT